MQLATYGDLFAGGGGWAEGAKALSLTGLWAIERNRQIAQIHHVNNPTIPMYVEAVESVAPTDLQPVDVLFASPPCQGWSKARSPGIKHEDKDVALIITSYVEELRPKLLFVENVPDFANYKLFRQFRLDIEALGYLTKLSTVEMADFGVPQTRLRVVLSCTDTRNHPELRPRDPYVNVSLEAVNKPLPWFPHISGLFSTFPVDEIPPSIRDLLPYPDDLVRSYDLLVSSLASVRIRKGKKIHHSAHLPQHVVALAIQSAHSQRKNVTFRGSTQPMFTIVASLAKQPTRILLPTGEVVRMTMRANARLQTFPDSYRIPTNQTLAGTILGNAVPPLFVKRLLELYLS